MSDIARKVELLYGLNQNIYNLLNNLAPSDTTISPRHKTCKPGVTILDSNVITEHEGLKLDAVISESKLLGSIRTNQGNMCENTEAINQCRDLLANMQAEQTKFSIEISKQDTAICQLSSQLHTMQNTLLDRNRPHETCSHNANCANSTGKINKKVPNTEIKQPAKQYALMSSIKVDQKNASKRSVKSKTKAELIEPLKSANP